MSGNSDFAGTEPGTNIFSIEWLCRALCFVALMLMLTVVGAEVLLRSIFSFSLGFADEIAAYLLVLLCFFSLSVTHANNGFHRVDFAVNMLPPRGQQIMKLIADLLFMGFMAVLIWQFARVELQAIRLGSLSPTILRTPKWIPMLSMVTGSTLFFISLALSVFSSGRAIFNSKSSVE